MDEFVLETLLSRHSPELLNFLNEKCVAENDERFLEFLTKFKQKIKQKIPSTSSNDELSKSFENKLRRFIVDKRKYLLSPKNSQDSSKIRFENEAIGAPPCLERFIVSISTRDEDEKFFSDVSVGDFVYAEVRSLENYSITVRLLCLDGPGVERDVKRLNIETFITRDDLTSSGAIWSEITKYTLIRAVVLSVDANKREINLTLKSAKNEKPVETRLGIVNEIDLPAYFRNGDTRRRLDYDESLGKSRGFLNPNATELLCERFSLPVCSSLSFSDTLNSVNYAKETYALSLRKVQTHNLSMKSVAKGVEKLRQSETTIAMQHFNKALQIEPENVEALVGRGALYANTESFVMAIKDFEDALRLDDGHTNAKKYLVETLLAQTKIYERKRKFKRLKLCCRRILELDTSNDQAKRILTKFGWTETEINAKPDSPSNSDSDVVVEKEIKSETSTGTKKSERKRKLTKEKTEEQNFQTQLRELYQKYGVDEKRFINDPELLEKLKKYHEKYSKSMKLRKCGQMMEEEIILSSYSSDSSSSSSSSDSSPSSSHSSVKKGEKRHKNSNDFRPRNVVNQILPETRRISTFSARNPSKNEETPKNNGQTAKNADEDRKKLVKDLKNMENFINSLKTMKK